MAGAAAAGAQALQVFDTWGGVLSPSMYREFSLRYLQRIAEGLERGEGNERTPLILFGKGTGQYVAELAATGDVTEEQVNGLEDFQQHVGGYVEALSSDDGDHTIWLNEEGKIAGLPVNSKGHRIVHELTILAPDDVIVGPVLITGDLADDGETYLPPTKALRERLGLDD